MKSIISPLLAALALTVSIAATPQAVARDLTIIGTLDAFEDVEIEFPVLTAKVYGAGHAHHFGRYSLYVDVTVDMRSSTSVGTFSLDVGNGDRLIGTSAGISGTETNVPNVYLLVEVLTIESGTGRFKGASGAITITRLANSDTLLSSGTIEGTVTVPSNRGHHR
jgi:hypothetical protein